MAPEAESGTALSDVDDVVANSGKTFSSGKPKIFHCSAVDDAHYDRG